MRHLVILLIVTVLVGLGAMAQNRTVSGNVTDDKGNALVGASVLARGTNVGTTTSTDGRFSLAVPRSTSVLVISYSGFGEKEVSLTNASDYTIQLSPGVNAMNEVVVVVAYGE